MAPGQRERFDLPVALLPTHTALHIPLAVVNGLRPGPRLWLSGAVHGDELNGVEIIRRVLDGLDRPLRRGTLVAVPIVNVFGFIGQSRYLPDRRDLNRSFPGSRRGSLASRIARLFMDEVVRRCTHGVDLHTAAIDRTNYPQVRGNLRDPETLRIATAFGAPAIVQSTTRKGSLRAAATQEGIPVIVYEGGEALRFNENAIGRGVRGVFGVMHELGMIGRSYCGRRNTASTLLADSKWIRARRGGLLRLAVGEGEHVSKGARIGSIADPLGADEVSIQAPFAGLVIGHTNNPVVHGGDAIVHLGRSATP